jgi:hypothetical protein
VKGRYNSGMVSEAHVTSGSEILRTFSPLATRPVLRMYLAAARAVPVTYATCARSDQHWHRSYKNVRFEQSALDYALALDEWPIEPIRT